MLEKNNSGRKNYLDSENHVSYTEYMESNYKQHPYSLKAASAKIALEDSWRKKVAGMAGIASSNPAQAAICDLLIAAGNARVAESIAKDAQYWQDNAASMTFNEFCKQLANDMRPQAVR